MPKPMSEDWRERNRAGETQARNEFKQHLRDAQAYTAKRVYAKDSPKPLTPKKKAKPSRSETHTFIGAYRTGGAMVSKQALKSQGPKAITDALKGSMNAKKMRTSASSYDSASGFESGIGPKRAQTEAMISDIQSGRTGESLWTAHKRSASKS